MEHDIRNKITKFVSLTILLIFTSNTSTSCSGNTPKFNPNQASQNKKDEKKPLGGRNGPSETIANSKIAGTESVANSPGSVNSENLQGVPQVNPANEVPGGAPKTIAAQETLPEPQDICAQRDKVNRVFVLDLKSGWFAGDGGDFFKSFVNSTCNDKVEISYVHVTRSQIDTNLASVPGGNELLPCMQGAVNSKLSIQSEQCRFGSFNGFDQIWILSGSANDSQDVDFQGGLFSNIRENLVAAVNANPKLSLLFSAGLSNVDHSNVLAMAALPEFGGPVFNGSPEFMAGTLPTFDLKTTTLKGQPLAAGTGLAKGTYDSTQPMFKGLNELFDLAPNQLKTFSVSPSQIVMSKCYGDTIINTKLPIIATDHCNTPVLAKGILGTHKVILEGNTSRFYGTKPDQYFYRLIVALIP